MRCGILLLRITSLCPASDKGTNAYTTDACASITAGSIRIVLNALPAMSWFAAFFGPWWPATFVSLIETEKRCPVACICSWKLQTCALSLVFWAFNLVIYISLSNIALGDILVDIAFEVALE